MSSIGRGVDNLSEYSTGSESSDETKENGDDKTT